MTRAIPILVIVLCLATLVVIARVWHEQTHIHSGRHCKRRPL